MRYLESSIALLLGAAAAAQVLVVDPGGSGAFRDLQAAIDAAPAGATIRVVGGSYGAITIRRSVRIVCEPAASVAAPFVGTGAQPAAITLLGGGTDEVALAGFVATATADGSAWNAAGPALRSTGFAQVRVYDSQLEAPRWVNITGSAPGASAIAVAGASTLLLERCTVRGSRSLVDSSNLWVLPGVPGIDAPDAHVVLLDAEVAGGGCGPTDWSWQPAPVPCPCPTGAGIGGPGVRCRHGFAAGSTVAGGAGSVVTWQFQPWGQQPDGPPFVAHSWTVHASELHQVAALRLGAVQQLAFAATVQPSFLALGYPQVPPVTVAGVPFVVVNPVRPISLRFLPAGASSFSLAVPNDPALLAFELAEQRFDLGAAGIVASNGVLAIVLP